MADYDCYFFVDMGVPEEERTMSILCVECHEQKMPDVGWFYKGSEEGYGPFLYKCCLCGKVIHAEDEGEHDEEEAKAPGEDSRG